MNYEPLHALAEKHRVPYNDLCKALRSALAAPMPEPAAWYLPSPGGDDSIFRDHRTVIACTGNKWEGFIPLYAAPPAAPADSQPRATKPVVSQKAANLTDNADMVMVPREPTPEMLAAILEPIKWAGGVHAYRAMIAAAPPAEQCYCDRMGIGVPGVSCGDCPTRDYKPAAPAPVVPIDMVLHCPKCGLQHIDAADPWVAKYGEEVCKTRGFDLWTNPPHKSHLCRRDDGGCGHIWRPADVPTNGVAALRTKGKSDMPPALAVSEKATVDCVTTIEVLRARIAMLESAAPVVREPQPTPRTAGCLMCGHCAATGERVVRPAVPLTDEQLARIAVEDEFLLYCDQDSFNEIARAIEKAHGIGGGGK